MAVTKSSLEHSLTHLTRGFSDVANDESYMMQVHRKFNRHIRLRNAFFFRIYYAPEFPYLIGISTKIETN